MAFRSFTCLHSSFSTIVCRLWKVLSPCAAQHHTMFNVKRPVDLIMIVRNAKHLRVHVRVALFHCCIALPSSVPFVLRARPISAYTCTAEKCWSSNYLTTILQSVQSFGLVMVNGHRSGSTGHHHRLAIVHHTNVVTLFAFYGDAGPDNDNDHATCII